MTDADWLIATDLDGTLLDDTYPVAEAVDRVQDLLSQPGVHVALASSKTLAELLHMVRDLDRALPQPFLVFENGGGWAWPKAASARVGRCSVAGYEITHYGASYAEICSALRALACDEFPFRGFADMDDAEVSARTGLSESQAALARRRLTSEPLIWQGGETARQAFAARLQTLGLDMVRGGRFFHVTSGSDKQHAVGQIKALLQATTGAAPRVVACGDAPNDLRMLQAADYPVVFPYKHNALQAVAAAATHAAAAGPSAWMAAVQQVLQHSSESDRRVHG